MTFISFLPNCWLMANNISFNKFAAEANHVFLSTLGLNPVLKMCVLNKSFKYPALREFP